MMASPFDDPAPERGSEDSGGRRWDTPWGPITPWTVTADHPDPARRMQFYLGVGQPSLLNTTPVPVFLSAPRLARYRTRGERFPVRINHAPYSGDSGAYSALVLTADPHHHPWWAVPDEYGALWSRLIDDIGPPGFVGIQDLPCEPGCLRRTGLSIADHQQLTLDNYRYLAHNFDHVPWLPTLQGWHPSQYVEHYRMYRSAGIDLAGRWVGIGSICRRSSADHDVAHVLTALAGFGMRMHGYGVSLRTLVLAGHLLHSADSQSWSLAARRARTPMPGCVHLSRPNGDSGRRRVTDCRNCLRYAVAFREKAMNALRLNHHLRVTTDPQLWEQPAPTQPAPRPRPRIAPRTEVTGSEQIPLFDAGLRTVSAA
ncbi:deazapurine DNA modification protein DpdA family protein [Nocardia sp. NPDC004573]